MLYKNCPLYALQSKKMLSNLLGMPSKKWFHQNFVQQNIIPYIDHSSKPRLVEAPSSELKRIQKRIKNGLSRISFPSYVYSGVKGKSYVNHAKNHIGRRYLFKIDISAFFPNIPREKVYSFFKSELQTSSDVAEILTNLCTSDLSRPLQSRKEIDEFLASKRIKHLNHLCTGASPSPLLSYLVNKRMFDELHSICDFYDITMTVYVDDAVFSSTSPIDLNARKKILNIVTKHGYNISKNKVKYYYPTEPKKITGVIVKADGDITIPNKLRKKIIDRFDNYADEQDINKLYGCLVAAKQIDRSAYPSIIEFINQKKKSKDLN